METHLLFPPAHFRSFVPLIFFDTHTRILLDQQMADWAAAAAAWAQSGEGEKTQFVPPPQPPLPKVEQQQPGVWGGADQHQAWMPPHQMDHAAAAAAHQGQQQHGFGTVAGGSDPMGGGGHQGFGQEGERCWGWGAGPTVVLLHFAPVSLLQFLRKGTVYDTR